MPKPRQHCHRPLYTSFGLIKTPMCLTQLAPDSPPTNSPVPNIDRPPLLANNTHQNPKPPWPLTQPITLRHRLIAPIKNPSNPQAQPLDPRQKKRKKKTNMKSTFEPNLYKHHNQKQQIQQSFGARNPAPSSKEKNKTKKLPRL